MDFKEIRGERLECIQLAPDKHENGFFLVAKRLLAFRERIAA
jgi:hypothetical protein